MAGVVVGGAEVVVVVLTTLGTRSFVLFLSTTAQTDGASARCVCASVLVFYVLAKGNTTT